MVRARGQKWDWRAFLTPEEGVLIAASDGLAEAIEKMRANYERRYAGPRAKIVNRCIQRAKKAARKPESANV